MTADHMQAIVQERYGPPSSLRLIEVDRPTPADDQVLVRVTATSVNPADWHLATGTPWLVRLAEGFRRPKRRIPGVDLAGRVEATGSAVAGLAPGDEVFGWADGGAFAEYVAVPASHLLPLPDGVDHRQAGSVGIAAFTALQALRDKAEVGPGTRLLLNGASGGVGTFALQMAVAMGAEVTAVCSTGNVEQARSLGAHKVIDYRTESLAAEPDGSYDAIVDSPGSLDFGIVRRLLTERGRLILVSGPKTNRLLGPLAHMARGKLAFARGPQSVSTLLARETPADLEMLAGMLADGSVVPVIDRTYPLADAAKAMAYLAEGHARAKVVLEV